MAIGSLPAPDTSIGGNIGDYNGSKLKIGVVSSRWNFHLTSKLMQGARRGYEHCGIDSKNVTEAWVPGAYELPVVCLQMALSNKLDAIVAMGVVIRGETTHYELVSENAARSLSEVSTRTGVPIIMGLLACETELQAAQRAGSGPTNKGYEAVLTAVETANVMKKLPGRRVMSFYRNANFT